MLIKSYIKQVASRKEFDMIKITDQVREAVEESGVGNGMVFVICLHTTTAIMINESLPCVEKDIELELERLVPRDYPYAHTHMLPSYGTCSGNAPGHLKSMLCGNHCVLPVVDGKMAGGHAQDIYFVEFDGLKERNYTIQIMGETRGEETQAAGEACGEETQAAGESCGEKEQAAGGACVEKEDCK